MEPSKSYSEAYSEWYIQLIQSDIFSLFRVIYSAYSEWHIQLIQSDIFSSFRVTYSAHSEWHIQLIQSDIFSLFWVTYSAYSEWHNPVPCHIDVANYILLHQISSKNIITENNNLKKDIEKLSKFHQKTYAEMVTTINMDEKSAPPAEGGHWWQNKIHCSQNFSDFRS